jgi:hypothetical protein
MIQVFEAQHLAEAHLVSSLLQAEGIRGEIRGDNLFSTLGTGTDVPGVLPTVWISEPADAEKAFALVAKFANGASLAHPGDSSWECLHCHEIHEPQFSTCWKCGATKAISLPA